MKILVTEDPVGTAFDAVVVKKDLLPAMDKALELVMQSERPWDSYKRRNENGGYDYCSIGAVVHNDFADELYKDIVQALFFAIPRETRDNYLKSRPFFEWEGSVGRREKAIINYNDKILRNKNAIFCWWMVAEANQLKKDR